MHQLWETQKRAKAVRIHDTSVVLHRHYTEQNLLLRANTTMDLNGQNTIHSQQAFFNKSTIQLALQSTKGHSEFMITIRRQDFQYYYKSRKIRNSVIYDNIPTAAYIGSKILNTFSPKPILVCHFEEI